MSTETAVKERGWTAHAHEVQGILAGQQTQFRRVVKPQLVERPWRGRQIIGDEFHEWPEGIVRRKSVLCAHLLNKCPYGKPGDRLWVREVWSIPARWNKFSPSKLTDLRPCGPVLHRASYSMPKDNDSWSGSRWRQSIHMPRWASRITLEVTGVLVERVQDISEEGAKMEGIEPYVARITGRTEFYKSAFHDLWDSLNAKRGFGWDMNPWVRIVKFKKLEDHGG